MKKNKLGTILIAARKTKHLTLRAVEKKTKKVISYSYLAQVEKGHTVNVSPTKLKALARVYQIKQAKLLKHIGA